MGIRFEINLLKYIFDCVGCGDRQNMSVSLVSFGSLYLYWRAQRAVNDHVKSGEPDTLGNDPLMYTALKTYLFAPALLGVSYSLLPHNNN